MPSLLSCLSGLNWASRSRSCSSSSRKRRWSRRRRRKYSNVQTPIVNCKLPSPEAYFTCCFWFQRERRGGGGGLWCCVWLRSGSILGFWRRLHCLHGEAGFSLICHSGLINKLNKSLTPYAEKEPNPRPVPPGVPSMASSKLGTPCPGSMMPANPITLGYSIHATSATAVWVD